MRTAALCVLAFLTCAGSARATFPGTNGKILFMRSGEIFAMNPDGSEQTNLTNNPAIDRFPAGSADGHRIAFTRSGPNFDTSELYVMNADGSGQENLTLGQALDLSAAWSPNGKRIAFASVGAGGLWDVSV